MDVRAKLVGKILGQYELTEIVGEGSLAVVYKAYQPSLERWVAVKVLHSENRKMLARFEREAKAVALLRHRNILMVYEYGVEEDWPYIAMEFVEQGTLENYLTGQPLDWIKATDLSIRIAQALHYAHTHGIIHRDVKPSNILMPQEDWPLLADFGLVKVSNPAESLTESDLVMGTPAYIPPEQARTQTADPRADMYSLGVIMFEMITGRLPFEYKNPNFLMMAHLSEPAPSPRRFNPGCPPDLDEVILTALQKSPDDRYTDLQAMEKALRDVVGGSTLPFPSSTSPSPEMPPSPYSGPFPKPSPASSGHVLAGVSPGSEARLLLPDQNVTIDLPEPGENGLIIGRSHSKRRVDIDLGPYGAIDVGISREHARLTRPGGDWLIDDLDSLNGTYVNKIKINPGTPSRLKNGDVIRCSLMSFVFLTSPRK